MKNKIVLLGIRGSVPVSGAAFLEYGHATSAMLVYEEPDSGEAGPTEAIAIDAGTGLLNMHNFLPESVKKLTILVSHIHLDHIQGLLMLPEMFSGTMELDIYSGLHEGLSLEEGLRSFMKPPIWPCTPDVFSDKVHFLQLPKDDFEAAGFSISSIPGSHPNDIDVFRLAFPNGRSFVHVGDYEVETDPQLDRNLVEFARNCDLLLMDGMYTEEEYSSMRGFGHSSWARTCKLAHEMGAKDLRVIHHAPNHTDAQLGIADEYVRNHFPGACLGKEGEIIVL